VLVAAGNAEVLVSHVVDAGDRKFTSMRRCTTRTTSCSRRSRR
jgi:hypothetical protein